MPGAVKSKTLQIVDAAAAGAGVQTSGSDVSAHFLPLLFERGRSASPISPLTSQAQENDPSPPDTATSAVRDVVRNRRDQRDGVVCRDSDATPSSTSARSRYLSGEEILFKLGRVARSVAGRSSTGRGASPSEAIGDFASSRELISRLLLVRS